MSPSPFCIASKRYTRKTTNVGNALIWGANGGIGRALVQALKHEGWDVLAVARHSERLHDLDVPCFDADVARDDEVAAAAMWAAREAGEVHLWVYTAGDILAKTAADTNANEWNAIMAANVTGAHLAVRHSLPLIAQGGHLVFLGAYVERITLPRLASYAAAKAALEAYTGALAKELRDKRVTLVRAPAVETPFWEKVPFKPPKNGMVSAEAVAEAIVKANHEGQKGVLDL